MPVSINVKRIAVKKQLKEQIIIQNYLDDNKNLSEIISLISRNISEMNKKLKADKIISVIKTEPLKAFVLLRKLKKDGFAIKFLTKYGFKGYISDFISFKTHKSFETRIEDFFSEYPDKKGLLKVYKKIKADFLRDCKIANSIYSSALNNVDVQKKIEGLELALKVAPWGSIESVKIVTCIILINSGENIGKNQESLILDKKNQKKQKKATA